MRRVVIGLLTVVAVVVLFVVLCTFRARQYDWVMLDRFGSLQPPRKIMYGWYLCWPTDGVVRLDKRLHLYQGTLTQVGTAGSDTISVQAFAAWRITDAAKFYRSTQGSDPMAQKFIDTKVTGQVAAVLAKHKLEELFNEKAELVQTGKLEEEVLEAVNGDMKAGEQGIELKQVGFSRLAFPPMVAKNVYDRMAAERAVKAEKFKSDGNTQAEKIKAEADSQAAATRAEAVRQAEQMKGQGDQEALAILQREQTPESLQFYYWWREIELFRTSMGKGGTVLILEAGKSVPEQLGPKVGGQSGGK